MVVTTLKMGKTAGFQPYVNRFWKTTQHFSIIFLKHLVVSFSGASMGKLHPQKFNSLHLKMDGWKMKFPIGKVTVGGGTVNFGGVPPKRTGGLKWAFCWKNMWWKTKKHAILISVFKFFFSWLNRTSTRNFPAFPWSWYSVCVWYVVFWVEGGYKSCCGGKTLVGCVIFLGIFLEKW